MRENPYPDRDPKDLMFGGDNFIRKTGETKDIAKLQLFVWDAKSKGNDEAHMLANPSQAELLYEQYQLKKEKLKITKKNSILEKYGGEKHFIDEEKKELIGNQTEN